MRTMLRTAVAIVLLLSCGCIPFNYFPSSKIIVKNTFGEPCEKISVATQDLVATFPTMEGFDDVYRSPLVLVTDNSGECTIPGRFRYAMPFVSGVKIAVNQWDWARYAKEIPGIKINASYDGVRVLVDKGKDIRIILKPLDIDYRRCNSITDGTQRLACLQYSTFFSAVREGDVRICDNYYLGTAQGHGIHSLYLNPRSLYGKDYDVRHYWDFRESYYLREACVSMIALKKDDREVCNYLKDQPSDEAILKGQCFAAFDDPQFAGMRGVSDADFRRFLCTGYDWNRIGLDGKRIHYYALYGGIGLFRWSCLGAQQSP